MRTRTGLAGLFFIGAVAVYSGRFDHAASATEIAAADTPDTAPGLFSGPATQSSEGKGKSVTASQVTVNDAGAVEIHVSDANLLEVLRMLSLQSQKNIIASKDVAGTVTANLYNVTVRQAMDAILHSNGCVYREQGNFIYVYTAKEIADQEKANRKLTTRVFRLSYIPATDAMAMIKPAVSADASIVASTAAGRGINTTGSSGSGSSGSGGSSGGSSSDSGGNSYAGAEMLVITDDADHLERVAKLIKEIDRRPQQVLVEATILAATLSDNNSLGVDFSLMGGVRFDQIASTPAQAISNLATGNVIDSKTTSAGTTAGTGQHSYGIGVSQPGSNGLNIGFLTNNVSVFIHALESVANTTVLANPKLMALDKQQAQVLIGSSDGYNTTTVTQTTSTQTVQLFDTGTSLSFRPYVGDDGYIRMEIHPEDSTGGVVNNLPHKTTTEVTSNVMIKDGHTIVIGGLFREQSQTQRSQIPGLGNIPFVGALFRQQQDITTRQEIIVLITPHIIKDDATMNELAEKELKHAEELRVGVRKGMMITGRERLADAAYQNAVEEMRKPDASKSYAIWQLDVATNLNPTFSEAIELKEKLTGEVVTTSDNSSVRSYVRRSILADTKYPAGDSRVPSSIPTTLPADATKQEPTTMPVTAEIR